MLMIVESSPGVCWMQPDGEMLQVQAELGLDANLDELLHAQTEAGFDNASPVQIHSHHRGGANFGLLDGGVTFISETIAIEHFRELVRGTAQERPY